MMTDCSESDLSTDGSEFSDDSEPPWQEEIDEDGELFYVEEDRSNDDGTLHGEPEEKDEKKVLLMQSGQQISDMRQKNDGKLGADARLPSQSATIISRMDDPANDHEKRIKTVFISVEPPFSYDNGSSSSLLKEMLGIISLRKTDGSFRFDKLVTEDSLIVSAMVPDGPVLRSECVEIGDVLLAINNVAVYHSNIEQVLQRIPHRMELRLTIHCRDSSMIGTHLDVIPSDKNRQNIQVSLDMLKVSNTDSSRDKLDPFQAVFYLTLNVDSETAKGEEDIIYMYPKDSLGVRKLKSTRGVFTTLADVSTDAFKSEVRSSVVFVNGELVHCAYYRHNSEVLVMCVPGAWNLLPSIHNAMNRTVRLLRVMHGSLSKAFESSNFLRLNHLFQLIFTTVSQSNCDISAESFSGMKGPLYGVKTLNLKDSTMADIDCSLSEFEAADFDDGLHSRGSTRRLYSILGTCLFYKGHMISNHIPDEDVKDILAFCQSYCLLNVSNVGRILIWREVFPHRKAQNSPFRETRGRYFYLLVGLRRCLLCVLLESGGCSISVEPKPRPPLLYINHATAVILNLEKLGLLSKIDEHILGPMLPSISRIDAFAKKSFFGGTSEKPQPGSSQRTASPSAMKIPFFSPSKKSIDAASSDHRSSQSARDSLRISKPLSGQEDKLARLTAGADNTLLFFIRFDIFSGVLLMPSDLSGLTGPMQSSMLENFQRSVVILHDRLFSRRRENPGQNVYEEGSMFLWSKSGEGSHRGRQGGPHTQYWVIGRSIAKPSLKEFYVCFQGRVRQDMTELAFELGFGIAG